MERVGPHSQAPTRFGEEGSELCSCVCLFLYCGLPGRGCPGGWPVMGLSHCHTPLWQCGIDEEQQQDD